jgi:hypothetical protein
VAVTQQFNTTTSMGRLTLNFLLSFAQFEREVTGERIRDKIAASKRKGLWMGGTAPLGCDLRERRLVVNPAEADVVACDCTRRNLTAVVWSPRSYRNGKAVALAVEQRPIFEHCHPVAHPMPLAHQHGARREPGRPRFG